MILYISTIIFCMTMIVIFNIVYNIEMFSNSAWVVVSYVVFATIIEIIIDLILAGIVHSQKDKYFEDKKIFVVSSKERKFYEKIKIRTWKDKIIELGALGGFRKNKLSNPNDIEYVNKFIMESYKGQIVHIFNIIFGFVIMAIPPYKWTFCVALPVALVNAILSVLPIFVLRYNLPKLQAVKTRLTRQKTSTE